jgi:hypothetical protein
MIGIGAASVEMNSAVDAISDGEVFATGSELQHDAREVQPDGEGEVQVHDVLQGTFPELPVRAVDAGGRHPNHHVTTRGARRCDLVLPDQLGTTKFAVTHRFHESFSSRLGERRSAAAGSTWFGLLRSCGTLSTVAETVYA